MPIKFQSVLQHFNTDLPEPEYPSCRQAMLASIFAHPLSHTVPQSPFRHTSTLPLKPPLSLMPPCEHPVSTMDAHQYRQQLANHDHVDRRKLTCYTLNSCIFRVATIGSVTVMGTINQSGLSCGAGYIIKSNDDDRILSEVCTAVCSCIYQEEKLDYSNL